MTTSDWIAISSILIAMTGGFSTAMIVLFRSVLNISNSVAEIKGELKSLLAAFARMESRWEKHDARIRRLEKKHR